MDKIKVMESLLGKINQLSVLLDSAPDGIYDITLYSEETDQIKRAAEELNVFLYHPCDPKPYYWFMYEVESDMRKKINVKVKGPYI